MSIEPLKVPSHPRRVLGYKHHETVSVSTQTHFKDQVPSEVCIRKYIPRDGLLREWVNSKHFHESGCIGWLYISSDLNVSLTS